MARFTNKKVSSEVDKEESSMRNKFKEPMPKEVVKDKLRERKKLSKQLLKAKRARLVVSNLSFKASEDSLKEYFEQYGEIAKVDLLRKPNGKLVGCCFVQFKLVQKAAKARHHSNGKEFLGRKMVVDFAMPKDKFVKKTENKSEVECEIKEEENNENEDEIEEDSENDNKEESKTVHHDDQDNDQQVNASVSDNSEEDIEEDSGNITENGRLDKKPHVISNDVTEGRTVFIKNVPFDATNDDLKQCMKQFGPVYYALICVDKYTEHSKGTAFVKFVNKEDCDAALSAGTELTLLGNVLDCHPALDRNQVNQKVKEKMESKKEPKDSRNLYLVKEGVILAGSKAAHGVSASDMTKRLQIEQYKTQMLRNLNMFVAKDRVVIHNLPASWDDKKLRILMQKYGGPGAVVREARVMRDMKNLDANGVGKSKEYGFVSFTRHENALQALRSLNNNPDIFSPIKRPIITFSIENKLMVKAKLKRLEKSRIHNPTSKSFQSFTKSKTKGVANLNTDKVKNNRNLKRSAAATKAKVLDHDTPKFSGVSTEPGKIEKMRSRYKLAAQAKMHFENVKKEKRKKKTAKKSLSEKKKEFIKQPKQKINKIKQSDDFSKLVNKYKKTLLNAPIVAKTKWYE